MENVSRYLKYIAGLKLDEDDKLNFLTYLKLDLSSAGFKN